MKFDKLNILHYLIFFTAFSSFLLAFIFSLIVKKLEIHTIFYGHNLNGNLLVIYNEMLKNEKKVYFLTINPKTYLSLKKKNIKVLFALYPKHMVKVFNAKNVVASHDLFFHKQIKTYFNIKTYHAGHAMVNKVPINLIKKFKNFKNYDEVWLFSNFEKSNWESEIKYKFNNLVVTGYPRVDNLKNLYNKKELIKSKYDIKNGVILFAPTVDLTKQNPKQDIFSYKNINFLSFLDNLLIGSNYSIIIKPHYKSKVTKESVDFINKSDNLFLNDNFKFNDDNELIAISDILMTDWSTVFIDYMVLEKPTIFLNSNTIFNETEGDIFYNKELMRILDYKTLTEFFHNIKDKDILKNYFPSDLKDMVYQGVDHKSIDLILKKLSN
ncbi:MAG: hypothetical protein CMQ83_01055 [Gammaproteobacteria bacterium]|nr:hypothetical protein [Gammaproteobacteria bacterium]|tara:strand:- start:271 stop:1413 length:1143 start_codon:yes stop_codon:yes gene_type:complete